MELNQVLSNYNYFYFKDLIWRNALHFIKNTKENKEEKPDLGSLEPIDLIETIFCFSSSKNDKRHNRTVFGLSQHQKA